MASALLRVFPSGGYVGLRRNGGPLRFVGTSCIGVTVDAQTGRTIRINRVMHKRSAERIAAAIESEVAGLRHSRIHRVITGANRVLARKPSLGVVPALTRIELNVVRDIRDVLSSQLIG